MLQPIEAVTSYIYKCCDNLTSRHVKGFPSSTRTVSFRSSSPHADLLESISSSPDPPPYGDFLPPPTYNSAVGGLSLVDRTDNTFKVYHRDLLSLSKEWARRRYIKGDPLADVLGGPQLAPNRIDNMRDVFMSIIQHQPCLVGTGKPPCDCRSVRWAYIKEEWLEVMFLLGNLC